MKCAILAAGYGERIRSITKDKISKVMLPIKGKPFLHYIIEYLKEQQIEDIIIFVGHKKESIMNYFKNGSGFGVNISYVEVDEPKGTAYTINKGKNLLGKHFFVVNGDTLFKFPYAYLYIDFKSKNVVADIALKMYSLPNDYGLVKINEQGKIVSFEEKKVVNINSVSKGFYINGGVYVFDESIFEYMTNETYSLERDVFPLLAKKNLLGGYATDGFFIDIGTSERYEVAKKLL